MLRAAVRYMTQLSMVRRRRPAESLVMGAARRLRRDTTTLTRRRRPAESLVGAVCRLLCDSNTNSGPAPTPGQMSSGGGRLVDCYKTCMARRRRLTERLAMGRLTDRSAAHNL